MTENSPTLYAGVVVEAPLTKIFYYRVPEHLAATPGDRVSIPFARRQTRGVVVAVTRHPPLDPKLIKDLTAVSPPSERIPPDLLELTKWVADYYSSGWGTVLAAALPSGVKHGTRERTTRRIEPAFAMEQAAERIAELAKRAPRQAEALRAVADWLEAHPGETLLADDPGLKGKAPAPALRQLEEKGLIVLGDPEAREAEAFPEADKRVTPTPDQEKAIAAVLPHIGAGFKSFLLYGVTGSGKTEVYMRLIAETLASGRGALVLVPEISLTPQTVSRFKRRFNDIAVLHSNLGDGERAGAWRRLCSGEIRLAVGVRSAVFAPVRDLGLVVVDEEHERSYKQDNDPRYNARDVAVMRASLAGAVAVLGSATPSLESWANAHSGKHGLLELPSRPGGGPPPRVEVVDLKDEWADVKRPVLFSRRLEQAVADCLKRREQAILFLNRRGFHTMVRCAACGEAVLCEQCDLAMIHHRGAGLLRCGYCGAERGVPENCPTCGARTLKFFGTGTERAEDTLASLFPKARLIRMDSDSMAARDSHRRALAAFARGEYDILLGTQIVAKGLDFPNVTLVGVLMADGALGMSDFRAAERTFQLVTQVIGRAGRADKAGRAVVQAFQPHHPAVASAVTHDYRAFAEGELADRKKRGYPPWGRLARIVLSGEKDEAVRQAADAAGRTVRAAMPERCRLLGPAACEVERIQGMYRRHMLLFSPTSRALTRWLAAAGVKPGVEQGVRLSVDMDPVSML